jgi:hypothetical protein
MQQFAFTVISEFIACCLAQYVLLLVKLLIYVRISDFIGVESCTILGYYAASSGNFLPTFRYNLSGTTVPVSEQLNR